MATHSHERFHMISYEKLRATIRMISYEIGDCRLVMRRPLTLQIILAVFTVSFSQEKVTGEPGSAHFEVPVISEADAVEFSQQNVALSRVQCM